MQINGPFRINIVTDETTNNRELQLSFTEAFQQLDTSQRIDQFRDHLNQLRQDLQQTQDPAEQQGMMTVLQISEQLLPHIEQDEIELQETIIIEIGPASPFDQLLSSATLK